MNLLTHQAPSLLLLLLHLPHPAAAAAVEEHIPPLLLQRCQ
jgi:hypothetical protein